MMERVPGEPAALLEVVAGTTGVTVAGRDRYRADVPSLQAGRTRTMVTTYDYRDWGQPVDVTP